MPESTTMKETALVTSGERCLSVNQVCSSYRKNIEKKMFIGEKNFPFLKAIFLSKPFRSPTRDLPIMARRSANHINIEYAPSAKEGDQGLTVKPAILHLYDTGL